MQLQCLLHCCSAILARFILLFSAVSRIHSSIHLFGSHVAVLKFGQTAIVYAKDRDRDKQTNRQKEWEIDRPQFNVLFKNIEKKKRFHFHSCCCCMVRYSAALKMIAMGQLGVAFIHFFFSSVIIHWHCTPHTLIFWSIIICVRVWANVYLFSSMADEHRLIQCFTSVWNNRHAPKKNRKQTTDGKKAIVESLRISTH